MMRGLHRHDHKCHWPGCDLNVAPRFWGCKTHWFMLPKSIRDKVWHTYIYGQEITKMPTPEYLEAAREAHVWATMKELGML